MYLAWIVVALHMAVGYQLTCVWLGRPRWRWPAWRGCVLSDGSPTGWDCEHLHETSFSTWYPRELSLQRAHYCFQGQESCCCLFTKSCLTLLSHGLQHTRLLCTPLSPGVCSTSCPLYHWSRLSISSSVTPSLSSPQSFPASRSFPMSWLFTSCGQGIWNVSFSISPSNEYSGLIYFMIDWFDLLAVQRTLKSLLQHHSSKVSILRCSDFFIMWRNSSRKNEEAGIMGTGDWFLGLIFACDVSLFSSCSCSCLQEHWNTCSGTVVVLAFVT